MFGDRFSGADLVLDWVDNLGAVPQYWSSNFSSDNADAWQVDFSGSTDPGGIDLAPATDLAHVRLVRTAP